MPEGFRLASAWVSVSPDLTGFKEKMDAELGGDKNSIKIPVSVDDRSLADATAKVKAKTKEISDNTSVKVKLTLDDAQLAAFEARVKAATAQASGASVSQQQGGAGAASAGAGGGMGFGGLIAGGIALGAGPVGGLALAAVPAAFAAIGIAAEKSNQDVSTAFTGMTTAAKASIQDGFSPFVPTLVGIADQAKSTVTGLEPVFAQAATDAGPLLEVVSTGLLKATSEGVTASVDLLQKLSPVANAIGDDFVKAERGIGGFLGNLDVGQSAQGLEILGTDLELILPAAGKLFSDVMPVGNAALGVFGPLVSSTATDLNVLKPILDAVGVGLSVLGPDISTFGPPALAALGIVKMMTGSWTDFGGAASKVSAIMRDADGEFDKGQSTLSSLAKVIGVTTQSAKDAAIADAQYAADKAALTDASAKQALVQAQADAAASNTAKNRVALTDAEKAEAVASKEAAAAQKALAEAEDASTFSFGPLGAALGAISVLALPFITNMLSGSDATSKLAGELGNLQQAASSATALTHLFATDPNAQAQLNTLQQYGVTLKDLTDAQNGSVVSQQKVADAAKRAADAISAKTAADQANLDSLQQQAGADDETGTAITNNTDALNRASDAVAQDKQARDQANQTLKDAQNQLQATTAAQAALTDAVAHSSTITDQAASVATALGMDVGSVTNAYRDLAAGNTYAMSATQKATDTFLTQTLAVDAANNTVSNYFKQADQSAVQAAQSVANANHSVEQATIAVSDAQHSYVQSQQAVVTAQQGVVTAQRSVTDALAGVVTAQNAETRAVVAADQAQTNLNTARQTAIEQLKSLHLQLADQVTSEESARVALFDQINASKALGVTPDNATTIAAQTVTSTNELQVNSAIALLKAQQSLNDTLNTGENLRSQVNAADHAGVDNAPGVLSAQQALASAQDQVTSSAQQLVKAHQAVDDAQANVLKAVQGVKDALYSEQQAQRAVTDALYNKRQAIAAVATAQQQLSVAQDNASRSMDINTQAGERNIAMLQKISEQLYSNEPQQQAANDLVNNTAQLFGISAQKAQDYLKQLSLIPQNFQFSLTGVAGADLSALGSAYNTLIERGARPGNNAGIRVPLAEGGPVSGPGGPRDDVIPALLSDREFVQPAASHDYYGTPFMEAIRQKLIPKEALPGFASGGSVDVGVGSVILAGGGSLYQAGVDALSALGFPAPAGLAAYVAPPPGAPGVAYNGPLGVTQFAPQILQALAMLGQSSGWLGTVERRMDQESGGNPNIVNQWDSNWIAGTPSVGLMQVIGPTFRSNAGQFAGTGPFQYGVSVNPLANIYAGLHYALGRYGTLAALNQPGGYDTGGYVKPGITPMINQTGMPEMLLPPGMSRTLESINTAVQGGGSPGGATVNHWYVSTQDPYQAAQLVAAQQQWNNLIGAHG